MARKPTVAVLALAAALTATPAIAAGAKKQSPVKKGTTYTGLTDEGSVCRVNGVDNRPCTVSVRTSDDGKRVAAMVIHFGAPCDSKGKYFRSSTRFENVAIDKAKFHVTSTYNEQLDGGGTAKDHVTMHGRFRRKNGKFAVGGDFHVTSKVTPAGAKKATRCDSGDVNWLARPR